jgi:hypothetical protein
MDWKFLLGAVGAIGAWLWSVSTWSESQKLQRAQTEYLRKEQLYRELLKSMVGFYDRQAQPTGATGVSSFLELSRLAWMYAPDDVVRAIEEFLKTQMGSEPSAPASPKVREGELALAKVVLALRSDLLATAKRPVTQLLPGDFGHYVVRPSAN